MTTLYIRIFYSDNFGKNGSIGILIGVLIRRSSEKISQCTGTLMYSPSPSGSHFENRHPASRERP
jgi:hypothetical protein